MEMQCVVSWSSVLFVVYRKVYLMLDYPDDTFFVYNSDFHRLDGMIGGVNVYINF
jgi:hypothetical protein